MNTQTPPTVLLLAAGKGERFLASGGQTHKLLAQIDDQSVLEISLKTVVRTGLPFCLLVSPTVFAYAQQIWAQIVAQAGQTGQGHLRCIVSASMGDTIAQGVAATPSASGWLVLAADLPKMDSASILAVAQSLSSPTTPTAPRVVQAYYGETPAHPVGFHARCFAELLALAGSSSDEGAKSIVQKYRKLGDYQRLNLAHAGAVQDVDTMQDLKALL